MSIELEVSSTDFIVIIGYYIFLRKLLLEEQYKLILDPCLSFLSYRRDICCDSVLKYEVLDSLILNAKQSKTL